jgi:MoxR-like ATPase
LHDVLRHRLILSYEAQAEGIKANKVIDRIVELVAVA